ncbi:unnamed protein product [Rotaria sp. Silwood2]|nr:unnamed protein product [Rotaria sp. Silwood2]
MNIISQQLYLWSTPIDIVERYQFYLNQLSTSNDKPLETQVFYNMYISKIRSDVYPYNPTTLTCYIHLQCNRGPFSLCINWREICDGRVDSINGKFDEEHYWQLEINECHSNENRCTNG